ncbi:hypothetical protein Tco_0186518 [Tanacetum coccineum]
MDYVKKSIEKRALHKMEYDSRVNERLTQTTEEKIDSSKALDASLVSLNAIGQSTRAGYKIRSGECDIVTSFKSYKRRTRVWLRKEVSQQNRASRNFDLDDHKKSLFTSVQAACSSPLVFWEMSSVSQSVPASFFIQMTFDHKPFKNSELRPQQCSVKFKAGPKVVPYRTSRQLHSRHELELLFHHPFSLLRTKGVSNDVLVSIEGVEGLKKMYGYKGQRKKPSTQLREKGLYISAVRITN